MPVELQNRLFKYFTDTLNAIVSQAKRTGKYDMGILGELWEKGVLLKKLLVVKYFFWEYFTFKGLSLH